MGFMGFMASWLSLLHGLADCQGPHYRLVPGISDTLRLGPHLADILIHPDKDSGDQGQQWAWINVAPSLLPGYLSLRRRYWCAEGGGAPDGGGDSTELLAEWAQVDVPLALDLAECTVPSRQGRLTVAGIQCDPASSGTMEPGAPSLQWSVECGDPLPGVADGYSNVTVIVYDSQDNDPADEFFFPAVGPVSAVAVDCNDPGEDLGLVGIRQVLFRPFLVYLECSFPQPPAGFPISVMDPVLPPPIEYLLTPTINTRADGTIPSNMPVVLTFPDADAVAPATDGSFWTVDPRGGTAQNKTEVFLESHEVTFAGTDVIYTPAVAFPDGSGVFLMAEAGQFLDIQMARSSPAFEFNFTVCHALHSCSNSVLPSGSSDGCGAYGCCPDTMTPCVSPRCLNCVSTEVVDETAVLSPGAIAGITAALLCVTCVATLIAVAIPAAGLCCKHSCADTLVPSPPRYYAPAGPTSGQSMPEEPASNAECTVLSAAAEAYLRPANAASERLASAPVSMDNERPGTASSINSPGSTAHLSVVERP
eukprot:gene3749-697_t